MATLVVTMGGDVSYQPVLPGAFAPMKIMTEDKKITFTPPYSPTNLTFGGQVYDYTSVDRPGRRPLQIRNNPQIPTMSFDLLLGPKRVGNVLEKPDQTNNLRTLKNIFESSQRTLIVGPKYLSGGLWRCQKFDVTTERLRPDQSIEQCTISMDFVWAQDITLAKGPTTGGVKPKTPTKSAPKTTTPPKKKASPPKKKTSKTVRKYTVKRGDTLSSIAIKFYKNASKWRTIADKNKIKDPKKLAVGKVLIIP